MENIEDFLKQLAAVRARSRMTEAESRQMIPERETRPTEHQEPRDWHNRLQNRNSERAQDWSGSSWSGQAFGGRNWSGGRER
jgi:hypothetical protein